MVIGVQLLYYNHFAALVEDPFPPGLENVLSCDSSSTSNIYNGDPHVIVDLIDRTLVTFFVR